MPQSFFCYLMRTCNFLLRSLGVFSCLLGPVIAVYGVEVSGLSIKQNVQGATLAHPDSPVVRLDELLGKYPFLEAHIDEKVEILFSGEDSSSQGSDSELTDTDKENQSQTQNLEQKFEKLKSAQ